ncbi:MAG: hypothetical protein OXC62_00025 [Aestuariivita sp.]|nr:hypothetical protein [Aestuariivita sp.]
MLYSVWNQIRTDAGLMDVRIHDFRHSYASMAISSGETVLTVGKLLGITLQRRLSNTPTTQKLTWNKQPLRWMLFLRKDNH